MARSWLIALASLAKAVVVVRLWLVALASLANAVAAARLWLVAFASLAKAAVAVRQWLVALASLAQAVAARAWPKQNNEQQAGEGRGEAGERQGRAVEEGLLVASGSHHATAWRRRACAHASHMQLSNGRRTAHLPLQPRLLQPAAGCNPPWPPRTSLGVIVPQRASLDAMRSEPSLNAAPEPTHEAALEPRPEADPGPSLDDAMDSECSFGVVPFGDFTIEPPLLHDEIQDLREELQVLRGEVQRLREELRWKYTRLEQDAQWWRRWYRRWRGPLHAILASVGMSSPR